MPDPSALQRTRAVRVVNPIGGEYIGRRHAERHVKQGRAAWVDVNTIRYADRAQLDRVRSAAAWSAKQADKRRRRALQDSALDSAASSPTLNRGKFLAEAAAVPFVGNIARLLYGKA